MHLALVLAYGIITGRESNSTKANKATLPVISSKAPLLVFKKPRLDEFDLLSVDLLDVRRFERVVLQPVLVEVVDTGFDPFIRLINGIFALGRVTAVRSGLAPWVL